MYSRVQQLNKIIRRDALALGYFQQFNDSAFHNLRLRFCGLSNAIHCHPLIVMHFCEANVRHPSDFSEIFAGLSTDVCSKLHTFVSDDLAGWVFRRRRWLKHPDIVYGIVTLVIPVHECNRLFSRLLAEWREWASIGASARRNGALQTPCRVEAQSSASSR
jgi:hypothetical protein